MGNTCVQTLQTRPAALDPACRCSFLWFKEPTTMEERNAAVHTKIVPKRRDFRDRTRAQLYGVLQRLPPHENVMMLKSWQEESTHFRVSWERLSGPCLAKYLGYAEPLKPVVAKYILQQLLMGLHHLHCHGVVHCDLKPHNIMLRRQAQRGKLHLAELHKVVLIDFDDSNALCESHGVGGRHSVAEDIWQLGAIFYKMLTTRHIQFTLYYTDLRSARHMRNRLEDWDVQYDGFPVFHKYPEALRLCIWMLRTEPNDRPRSCADVLLDPWMRNAAIEKYLEDNPPKEPTRFPCLMDEEDVRRIQFKNAKASTASACSSRSDIDSTAQAQ
ncbi:hypothetical protein Efla_003038 [Eimeria flavescens]